MSITGKQLDTAHRVSSLKTPSADTRCAYVTPGRVLRVSPRSRIFKTVSSPRPTDYAIGHGHLIISSCESVWVLDVLQRYISKRMFRSIVAMSP